MGAANLIAAGIARQSNPHLPERVAERIESERRRLNRAAAVLIGAELTAEYSPRWNSSRTRSASLAH